MHIEAQPKTKTYKQAFLRALSMLAPARKILTPHIGVVCWAPENLVPVGVVTWTGSKGRTLKAVHKSRNINQLCDRWLRFSKQPTCR